MKGEFQSVRWIEAKNNSGSEIPSFGLAKVVGATLEGPGRTVILLERPDEDSQYPIAINSWHPIPNGGYGVVSMEGPVYVWYDDADTPAIGESWGSQQDSFKAEKDQTGLTIIGSVQADRDIVLANIDTYQFVEVITFTLAEALETTDENVTATIYEQNGQGRKHSATGAGAITVHNLPKQDGDYEFYGDSGDYGRASWMYGNHFKILIVECP
jgi:hypothetical protein